MSAALRKKLEVSLQLMIQRCGAIKAFLDEYDPALHDFLIISEKLDALTQIHQHFIRDFNELLAILPEDEVADRIAKFHGFQDDFDSTVVRLKRINLNHQIANPNPVNPPVDAKITLPPITLPQFKGKIGEWVFFRDKFTSLITENQNINEIQKLHYLKSSLIDEAASLQSTNDTFHSLWTALKERYEVKRVIADSQISELFGLQNLTKESATALQQLIDKVTKNIRVLETLDLPVDGLSELIIINLISTKLDPETRRGFELQLKPNVLPRFVDFIAFLRQRCHTLESIELANKPAARSAKQGNGHNQKATTSRSNAFSVTTNNCGICQSTGHNAYRCEKLVAMTPEVRYTAVKKARLCINCLRSGHASGDCTSSLCRICQKRHNSLLHFEKPRFNSNTVANQNGNETNQSGPNVLMVTGNQILLSTILVNVLDAMGTPITCRALLDNGSQSNFMTENIAQLTNHKRKQVDMSVYGFTQKATTIRKSVIAKINSLCSPYATELEFLIVQNISGLVPIAPLQLDAQKVSIPSSMKLADPQFYKPQNIDLLIGAEIFFEVWTGAQMKVNDALPPLQGSVFGWVVAGKVRSTLLITNKKSFCGFIPSNPNEGLLDAVKRFWEIETINKKPFLTVQEKLVEQHFIATHSRQPDGRFVVHLPVKPEVEKLGDSRHTALSRFHLLERKLKHNSELKHQYCAFMEDYEQLGHMTTAPSSMPSPHLPSYFLPHHAVLKPDSSTTKCRVVFDGSAKTTTGFSLNDILHIGATVQQDLMDIILRFRTHQYAFTADISKMYRQVLIDKKQQQLQQILWRAKPTDEIKSYFLKTVTYGTASAPFLATRVLNQLADDEHEHFPEAAVVAKRDFYVDDVLSGANDLTSAINLQQQLVKMLRKGGFELHKWCANTKELLDNIPVENRAKFNDFSDDDRSIKTLGVIWCPSSDKFIISGTKLDVDVPVVTKRSILSLIARLFDPLGLAGPVVLSAKATLQQLWEKKIDWDQPLDAVDVANWSKYQHQLQNLRLEVPRCIIPSVNVSVINLHGFCDASTVAYGCCVYIQCEENGHRTSHLLCAKSRVAPLKVITIPRLELCSAVLLAELIQRVKVAMQIKFTKTVLWSDSTVALAWIRSQSNRMKTFVSHRVAEIQDMTHVSNWRHINTVDNPADIISRGLLPEELPNSTLWWHGPKFLIDDEKFWPPETATTNLDELPEMKTVVLANQTQEPWPILTKFSRIIKLQRVFAYMARFLNNCRKPKQNRQTGPLKPNEVEAALQIIIRAVQLESMPEYSLLKEGKGIATKSTIRPLNVFMEDDNLLRVGGRIRLSRQNFDTKHQILLPKTHHITKLLVRHLHETHGHVGQQALLAIIRQRFWPIGARQLARNVTRSCVHCFKCSPHTVNQFMGDLPSYRVNSIHPFTNTGVDYAGPMTLKVSRRVNTKAYVSVFICLATKAVHFELVSDLSSKAFIAALTRFVSRRGLATNIYSDNGTNFVGAKSELDALYKILRDRSFQTEMANECAERQINFHTIPPRAPHFGGIWEAAVKSLKYHLRRIVGTTPLYFEELDTVLKRVEAILNSRPLTPLSSDPEDVNALTPGHFLVGRPLVAVVEPNLLDISINRLTRWQLIQRLSQHFWQRWNQEYLTGLQRRTGSPDVSKIELGMLVVIKEDNLPPSSWLLGRIIELHPGRDNIVRVVSLKTKNGVLKRPVVKICILPIDGENQRNEDSTP